MKIYYQINNNDCGISVAQSLIKHFHGKEISKEELYGESNISGHGLSVMDLEMLCKKYGIILEAYEMTYEEFKNYNTREYFVLILNRDSIQHFVIGKKTKNRVTIYDPEKGKIRFSYGEMEDFFTSIFITVSSREVENLLPKKLKENREIYDLEKLSHLFLLNVSVFLITIVISFLMKYGYRTISNGSELVNLKHLMFFAIAIYALYGVGEYLEGCLVTKHRSCYLKSLHRYFLNSLKTKKNSYFLKLGKDQFLLFRNHIENIAVYHSEFINRWLMAVLTITIVTIILVQISLYSILLILVSAAIQYFFWRWCRKVNNDFIPTISDLQNRDRNLVNSLKSFVRDEVNCEKLEELLDSCRENYLREVDENSNLSEKNHFLSKSNSFLNNFVYLFTFFLFSYFIFLDRLDFNHLIIMSFLWAQLNKSINSLAGYYNFRPHYFYSKEIYNQLVNIDNDDEIGDPIELPSSIVLKNLFYSNAQKIIFRDLNLSISPNSFIYGPSGIGKTAIYKLISGKIGCPEESIYFDDVPHSSINSNSLNQSLIYQCSEGYLGELDLVSTIGSLDESLRKTIVDLCKRMNLTIDGSLNPLECSSGQKQLLNIISLLKYSGKILLLDEIASHINIESKRFIFKRIIPHLAERNFLICSEHCPELKDFFPNQINLEEYVYSGQ